jgi:hypothetical protein
MDWILSAVQLFTMWSVGNKNYWAWGVGYLLQFLWIWYSAMTGTIGFAVVCPIYAFVYVRNFFLWRRKSKEKENNLAVADIALKISHYTNKNGVILNSRPKLPNDPGILIKGS